MSWFRNVIAGLYDAVLAPVAATRNALSKRLGTSDFDRAMVEAADRGNIEIVKLCKEWGATYFDEVMRDAASEGHIGIVKLYKEWGATDFDRAMVKAAGRGHTKIVKLCQKWLYGDVHAALLRYHYERKFFKKIQAEMLPVAWHPDRFWSWCVDEGEKSFLKKMRKS